MAHAKIMLVDDDDISLFVTQHLLKKMGFSSGSILMPSGFTALEYIKENLNYIDKIPDIIILDIDMPLVDGWDFIDEFKKIKQHITKEVKIYVLSGNNFDVMGKKYVQSGIVIKCFTKPLKIHDLEDILHKNYVV